MKKRLAIIMSVIIAIAVVGASVFAYATENTKKNSIGIEKALNIAMVDAGVLEQDIDVTKAKMEFKKSTFVYDIEFDTKDNYEYEYLIKAIDGTILHKTREYDAEDADDYDDENNAQNNEEIAPSQATTEPQNPTTQVTQPQAVDKEEATKAPQEHQGTTTSSTVSLEKAKSIALQEAGVSKSDAKFIHAYKDTDDGIEYYDIEFKTSSYEYEYEIDLNGRVLSRDKERIKTSSHKNTDYEDEDEDEDEYDEDEDEDDEDEDEDDEDEDDEDDEEYENDTTNTAKYIGVDKAKQIALSHAGLSAGKVRFTKAKFERDDGISQYEIEFETSTTEYEYEIDAVSGKIISRSSEPLDD